MATGIELAEPRSDATMQAIKDAMHCHCGLFFLGPQLDDAKLAAHLAVAEVKPVPAERKTEMA